MRPLLEYSCNINKLESVQRRATRWITDDDYNLRLSKLNLLGLLEILHFLFNVINEHYDVDISHKLIFCKDRIEAQATTRGKMTHWVLSQI